MLIVCSTKLGQNLFLLILSKIYLSSPCPTVRIMSIHRLSVCSLLCFVRILSSPCPRLFTISTRHPQNVHLISTSYYLKIRIPFSVNVIVFVYNFQIRLRSVTEMVMKNVSVYCIFQAGVPLEGRYCVINNTV